METCSWLIETNTHPGDCYPDEEYGVCQGCEMWWENGGRGIVECGASVTEHPNGWECEAGHSHYYGAEYFDEEEIAGMAARGISLPPNARPI